LTSGSIDSPFDEVVATIQNYGFRQTVFEVERLAPAKRGAVPKIAEGAPVVLRPSAAQAAYDSIKPGDRVQCTGLSASGADTAALYRIRRVAEGFSRKTMTERA
jgi:hypothetical protein